MRYAMALVCALMSSAVVHAATNVLFIVSDDLACQLGCYGNTVVQTPNIDRLAKAGVRFDRAYCNYPVCNASRTSFLSGRRPDTTGVFGNATDMRVKLGDSFQFLPEYFHSQGYFTAGIGKVAHGTFADDVKWDVQLDPQSGDDEDSKENNQKKRRAKKQATEKAAAVVNVPFAWYASDVDDSEEPDGITARKVAKLMEEHKDGPFFIAAGFHKPHVPHGAPKKYFDMYPPEQMVVPTEPSGHAKLIPPIAEPPKYFPDLTEEQARHIISHYYAATTFMDTQVGVLLETMDRLKLWDNTVVVFIGDHGWHLGEHGGFWAKSSLMKQSARSPLLVYAPERRPASRVLAWSSTSTCFRRWPSCALYRRRPGWKARASCRCSTIPSVRGRTPCTRSSRATKTVARTRSAAACTVSAGRTSRGPTAANNCTITSRTRTSTRTSPATRSTSQRSLR